MHGILTSYPINVIIKFSIFTSVIQINKTFFRYYIGANLFMHNVYAHTCIYMCLCYLFIQVNICQSRHIGFRSEHGRGAGSV